MDNIVLLDHGMSSQETPGRINTKQDLDDALLMEIQGSLQSHKLDVPI